MRSVFGLLVALTALVIIWLWATGRFDAAYNAIKTGNASSALPSTPGQPGTGAEAGGSWSSLNSIKNQTSYVQVTPSFILPQIPQYVS